VTFSIIFTHAVFLRFVLFSNYYSHLNQDGRNKIKEEVHTEYFVSADVPMDDSDTDDACVDEHIMRNNPVVRRAVDTI